MTSDRFWMDIVHVYACVSKDDLQTSITDGSESVRHSGTDIHSYTSMVLEDDSSHVEYSRHRHDGVGVGVVVVVVCVCWGAHTEPAGSSVGVSQSPCQELTGPIREELRPHPCMQIRPSEEQGRGHLQGFITMDTEALSQYYLRR